jgi:Cu(I)/Ag(I) efflux system membrane fusion protein
MNPQVTSPTPKKDPMGMDYVPVYAGEAGDGGIGAEGLPPGAGPNAVRIDPRIVQETGVTTETAKVRVLSQIIRTVGIVKPDERRLYSVTVKFTGWIERLYVNFTGDRVRKGDPLAAIYSPELLATQREYLLALRYARLLERAASRETRAEAKDLLQSARRRLLLWDIPAHEIEDLDRRGEPTRLMIIHSPADGVVLEKEITAGSQVQPGMTLLRIADLKDVWVFAQIYPHQLSWIGEGQAAEVRVPGVPSGALEGRVSYIQPVVSTEARTVEVRIEIPQPSDRILLKPNMYANIEIRSPVERQAVAVREQAVIRTGERNVVIVALGHGYFEPRDVELGATGGGYVEILDGIEPGEEVVTSSEFLIDSESNLRTALGAMGAGAPGHAGHSTEAPMSGSGAAQPRQSEPERRPGQRR